jgi:hypothetical protein
MDTVGGAPSPSQAARRFDRSHVRCLAGTRAKKDQPLALNWCHYRSGVPGAACGPCMPGHQQQLGFELRTPARIRHESSELRKEGGLVQLRPNPSASSRERVASVCIQTATRSLFRRDLCWNVAKPWQPGRNGRVGSGNHFKISGSFPPCAVWHAGYTVIANQHANVLFGVQECSLSLGLAERSGPNRRREGSCGKSSWRNRHCRKLIKLHALRQSPCADC